MSDYRLTTLARAIRSQLGLSTSIAVGVALISTPAANATTIPQMLPEQNLLRMENAITSRELVFIDADVPDPQRLLIGLKQGVETIILDRNQGGIEQITRVLEARSDISAVHIVAHGEAGLLKLGNTRLDIEELNNKAILLRRWFKDSGQGKPDLLLYACDVAKGDGGAAFVEQLAVLTGADVAASTDKTGIGGDWDLEYNVGNIETALAFKEEDLAAYPHSLKSFTVTKTADTNDGACNADCSLREAVAAANASVGTDSIGFSTGVAGVITLTLGQINIEENLVINGPGAGLLEISGGNASRIFAFNTGNAFTIRNLALRHGNASGSGGAISSNCCSTELRIEDSVITGNISSNHGGGIYQDQGDVYIIRSDISNNYAGNDGGGINQYQHGSSDYLVIVDSLISNNEARNDGGGFSTDGDDIGSRTIFNSVFTNNVAGDDGGGMFIYSDDDDAYYTYITDTTISNNTAGDDGGGIFFYADDDGYLVINNSTISGNSAEDNGGGISFYSDDGAMDINNSTISGNYANDNGGGIFVDEASRGVHIRNSTIVFNEAGRRGGGIYNDRENMYVFNSIIAENTADYGDDVYNYYSGDFVLHYSLIGDTSDFSYDDHGGSIFDVASGVSPNLTSAGGPTKVHLLEPGSLALNSGEPGFTGFEFDQRGRGSMRVAGGQLDMGAVEMQDPPVPIPTLQNWALILLALLLPGMALRWRRKLEKKQLAS